MDACAGNNEGETREPCERGVWKADGSFGAGASSVLAALD